MGSTLPIDGGHRGEPNGLLAHGFGRLIRRGEPQGRPSDVLVVVAPDRTPASAWLASFLEATRNATPVDRIAVCDAAALGRLLGTGSSGRLEAELTRHRLVVIDHADEVGESDRQHALAQLLDALVARGVATCVSVATHPATATTLEPQLASRLAAGLLVIPTTTAVAAVRVRPGSSQRRPTIARVVATVARHFGHPVAELLGPSRCRAIAEARSIAMYVARQVTGQSYHAVGTACGGRDHTTVIHAVRVVGRRMTRDLAFAAEIARLSGRFSDPAARSEPVNSTAVHRRTPNRRRRSPSGHRPAAGNRPRHRSTRPPYSR